MKQTGDFYVNSSTAWILITTTTGMWIFADGPNQAQMTLLEPYSFMSRLAQITMDPEISYADFNQHNFIYWIYNVARWLSVKLFWNKKKTRKTYTHREPRHTYTMPWIMGYISIYKMCIECLYLLQICPFSTFSLSSLYTSVKDKDAVYNTIIKHNYSLESHRQKHLPMYNQQAHNLFLYFKYKIFFFVMSSSRIQFNFSKKSSDSFGWLCYSHSSIFD